MTPTIGRIVIIHQPNGEQLAGIITIVHNDDCVNLSGFIPNGNVSGFSSLQRRGVAPEGATCWDWPEMVGGPRKDDGRLGAIEAALRSQGISIPDCAQLREDVLGEPESRDNGAIVIDGEPVVGVNPDFIAPPSESEYRAHLEGQPMDDLRAMANDLPISNMHDLDKPALIDQILVCLYGGVAIDPEEPNGEG